MRKKSKKIKYGKQRDFSSIGTILEDFKKEGDKKGLPLEFSRDKYISHEFQKYGYELAKELGDLKNKSLYIKLAKETPRGILETAKNFVKDAYDVKSPAKLYMWKLSELKKAKKANTQKELKTTSKKSKQ